MEPNKSRPRLGVCGSALGPKFEPIWPILSSFRPVLVVVARLLWLSRDFSVLSRDWLRLLRDLLSQDVLTWKKSRDMLSRDVLT